MTVAAALDTRLLERVRQRVAAAGLPPTPALVAAALREEGGPLLGDADTRLVLRALRARSSGPVPLSPSCATRA